ncbi:MAG: hypothetical protein ACYC2G_10070 [Gemmatimonadaceae bacterium]
MAVDTELSPRQRRAAEAAARSAEMHRWERLRSQGRSHFVWRHGVAGWGIPAAILTMAYKLFEARGLAWSLSTPLSTDLRHAFALIAIAFPALGYLFGGWLWTQGEARYARLRRESGGGAAAADGGQ